MYPWQSRGKKIIAKGSEEANVEGSIDPSPSLKRSTFTPDTTSSASTQTATAIEDSEMKQIDVIDVEGSDGSSSAPERDTTHSSPDTTLSPTSASIAINEDSEGTQIGTENIEKYPAPGSRSPSKPSKATVNEGFVTEKIYFNDVEGGNPPPPPMQTSPTNTARTTATSSNGSIYTNTPQKFQDDEIPAKSKSSSRGPGAAALIIGMKKPILCIVVFILISIGLTAFFGWFRVPGLDKEIDRLRAEVNRLDDEIDRLTFEVERLGSENDRFEILNGDLQENADELNGITRGINVTVVDLRDSTDELTETRLRLESDVNALHDISDGLTISNAELKVGLDDLTVNIQNLKQEKENLENLKEEFNQTAKGLRVNVRQLNVTREELTNQVGGLEEISNSLNATLIETVQVNTNLIDVQEQLTNETSSLSIASNLLSLDIGALIGLEVDLKENLNELKETSMELNRDLNKLEGDLANFTAENERLGLLNSDLNVISNFSLVLNLTASDTLTSFTDFLIRKIEDDRNDLLNEQNMLIAMYQRAFKERIQDWSCVYEVQFGERFTNTPISDDTSLDSIIYYIDERLFRPLCLDVTNFRDFLDANETTTSRDVNSAVIDFTGFADSHYFPQDNIGVSAEDWINASFSCDKLVNNYLWTSNIFTE